MNRFPPSIAKMKGKVSTSQKPIPVRDKLPTITVKQTQNGRLDFKKPKPIIKLHPKGGKTFLNNVSKNLVTRTHSFLGTTRTFMHNMSQKTFGKYLLVTNTTVTISLSGAGDYLQQLYQIKRGRHKHWDKGRTLKLSLTGFTIGPACHFWYQFLDKKFPGKSLQVLFKKIIFDQILFSPVCISLFLVSFGLFSGHTLAKIKDELWWKGGHLFLMDWVVWPPAQFVNFKFLPTKYRVVYDNTISLLYDCYYSYVSYWKTSEEEEKKEGEDEHIHKSLP